MKESLIGRKLKIKPSGWNYDYNGHSIQKIIQEYLSIGTGVQIIPNQETDQYPDAVGVWVQTPKGLLRTGWIPADYFYRQFIREACLSNEFEVIAQVIELEGVERKDRTNRFIIELTISRIGEE